MPDKRRFRKTFLWVAAALVGSLLLFFTLMSFRLEPLLKKKLHSLIIDGSDSLYRYSLGSLQADVFGANVKVENLRIWIDSSRFREMRRNRTLPSLTINLDMKQGRIRGISLLSILFGNSLKIEKIDTREGHLTLARHYSKPGEAQPGEQPFWKAIKPSLNGISIKEIKLDNIGFTYWDLGRQDVQLQFRRCDALLQDIRIDSAMLADTTRLGYLGHLSFRLQKLAYLSADSVYKLNVDDIRYSSNDRQLTIDRFDLQPSDSAARLVQLDTVGKTYFSMRSPLLRFHNLRLERFMNTNSIWADSLVLQSPVLAMTLDRSVTKDVRSKMGKFPHQLVAKASMGIYLGNLSVPGMQMTYTEKSDRTEKAGSISISEINILAQNITNDSAMIRKNPVCTIRATGKLFGSSPVETRFRLHQEATDGLFEVEGSAKALTAQQLNPLSENLASLRLQSLKVDEVLFALRANNDSASGSVQMRYSGLAVQVLKTDKESGDTEVNRFLSKLLNRYMTHPSNPGTDGVLRRADDVQLTRLLSHSFFGLIWKTIFAGMQTIVLKSGDG